MKKLFLIGMYSILLWACTPKREDVYIDDLDLTATSQRNGVDFTKYKTFALPDSIYIFQGDTSLADSFALETVDEIILDEVEKQMKALNYTLLDKTENPDVGLEISRLVIENIGTGYVPGWCGGGWGGGWWGYPGYGYCYPGYTYDYSYKTGTIIINYLDLINIDDTEKLINSNWVMTSNGYIDDNAKIFDETRVRNNISRGFEQSQYLRTNQ